VDGRAVKRGSVMAHDAEFPDSNVGNIEFGSHGRFAQQLFMGRRYEVYAITSNDLEGHESLWFFETAYGEMIFDSPAERLTLRMSESRNITPLSFLSLTESSSFNRFHAQ